jgi:hypothetical protein
MRIRGLRLFVGPIAASRSAGWTALGVDRKDVGSHASLRVSDALEQSLREVGALDLLEGGGEEIGEDLAACPCASRIVACSPMCSPLPRLKRDAQGDVAIGRDRPVRSQSLLPFSIRVGFATVRDGTVIQ